MNGPLQIGITGGIGAGKSLAAKVFHILGVPVYDADSRAKNLMTSDPVLVDQIKKEFGSAAYLPSGDLNRAFVSQQAFGASEKVDALNQLVHPRVAQDYASWASSRSQFPYVMKEAALLFEAGSYKSLDKIIVVTAPEPLRIRRVLARDPQRSEFDIKKILANQMPEKEKAERADYVLVNDEEAMLLPQILTLHETFRDLRKKNQP